MQLRGPERFYSIYCADDYGFYPLDDLPITADWPLAKSLEFAMGARPLSVETVFGYGAYLEHEDFWVFGRTAAEVLSVAREWPVED